jgi:hypothetical protein
LFISKKVIEEVIELTYQLDSGGLNADIVMRLLARVGGSSLVH